ncbi:PilW family protein [Bacillus alkalicellulosilyticus]|uniref:PilW family protein n=1 Tax=Alkalihalobacterium alkalicellulosilyticum TaxID=1912214 RepID=UPI00099831E8|nr:prepilin-type N-terminal cleavage/methylation domain-containing protein [Bacillus alkalicellulosilyticus]
MKRMLNQQDGITLVELLATLAIMSFLLTLLYGVFFSGMNHVKKGQDTVALQQEANYITNLLTKMHQTQDTYIIDINPTTKALTITDHSGTKYTISNPNLEYKISYQTGATPETAIVTETTFHPKAPINPTKIVHIKLVIISPNQQFEVKTILSRM